MVLAISGMAQDPPHQAFTVADGLPSNTVYCAAQDRDGYLWLGTEAGACRFDGETFEVFTAEDGLPDNEVIGLLADPEGRTWFLGFNGRAGYYSKGKFHHAGNDSILAEIQGPSGLTTACPDGTGGVWLGSFLGDAFHWHDGRVDRFTLVDRYANGDVSGIVKPLERNPNDIILLCNASMYQVRNGVPIFLRKWAIGSGGYPLCLTWQGKLIALVDEGLIELTDEADRPMVSFEWQPNANGRLAYPDRDGHVWMIRDAGGIHRMPILIHSPLSARWFEGIMFNSVFQDGEGNIWLCTDGHGALMIDRDQLDLKQYVTASGVESSTIHSLCVTVDSSVFFGDGYGRLYGLQDDRAVLLGAVGASTILRDRVRMMAAAPNGDLWLAMDTWCGRYVRRSDGRAGSLEPLAQFDHGSHGMPGSTSKSIAVGPKGQVVMGSFGLARVVEQGGRHYARFDSALFSGQPRVYAPFIDSAGRIWSENENRLLCNVGSERIAFPELDKEFGLRITSIAGWDDSTLVVGTSGAGVKLVRGGQVIGGFTSRDGLGSDQVRRLRVKNRLLLVATDGGAAVISDPLTNGRITTWNRANGLPTNDVLDIDTDGKRLWLATAEGVCSSPLLRIDQADEPPQARFVAWAIGDSTHTVQDDVRVPLGMRLQLRAKAFCFAEANIVRFAFREAGDTLWSESATGTLSLSDLAPGEHRFEVRARKGSAIWGSASTLTVQVEPPWHRSIWFRSLLACALALAGIILVRYLSRRKLKEHMIQLEREQALDRERQRIAADVHDDLGADISHLLMLARQSADSGSLPEADKVNLALIEDHASGLIRKVDEIVWSLDARDDRLLPTLIFIQRQVEDLANELGIAFRTMAVTGPDGPMPSRARRELYLLVREVLHNIVKHNSVRTLRFEARLTATAADLLLEHDGREHGLPDQMRARTGHGLANIQQRLELLEGELLSETSVDGGTRVRITIRRDQYDAN
jgi:signal transduction histidine kinase/streptogramin lyase